MSATAYQGRLKLNPTRATAGDRERRQAWHRIHHGPATQYVAVRRSDAPALRTQQERTWCAGPHRPR